MVSQIGEAVVHAASLSSGNATKRALRRQKKKTAIANAENENIILSSPGLINEYSYCFFVIDMQEPWKISPLNLINCSKPCLEVGQPYAAP